MQRVCRTCLQIIPDIKFVNLSGGIQSMQIKSELMLCVPEMVLDSVAQSVMCTFCVGALHSAYDFKRQCLQTEERVQNYIQNVHLSSDPINLNNVCDLESGDTNFKLNPNDPEITFDKPETYPDDSEHDSNMLEFENAENIKEELPSPDEEVDLDDYKITRDCLGTSMVLPESDTSSNSRELATQMKEEDSIDENIAECSIRQSDDGQNRDKPFQCTNCDYRSADKSNLERHLLIHNAIKPFKCTVCDFDTRRKETLVIHMREHSGEKPYKCSYCEFRAVSKYALNKHCMQTHEEKRPHKCPKCKYSAAEKVTLRRHMTVHSSDKPFKCDQCNFSTAWKVTWAKHVQGHSGMMYKCDICGYSTIYKHSLSLHLVRHSGDKPFMCSKCDYRAAEKSKLNRHILTHESEKPFTCSICNFGTTRNDSLKKHMMCHQRNDMT